MQKTILSLLILPILALGLLWSSDAEAYHKCFHKDRYYSSGHYRCTNYKWYRCEKIWGSSKYAWKKKGTCERPCKYQGRTIKDGCQRCYYGARLYCRNGSWKKNKYKPCLNYCLEKGIKTSFGKNTCAYFNSSIGRRVKCMPNGSFKKLSGACCIHNRKTYSHGKQVMCFPVMANRHIRCIHGKLKMFAGPCHKTSYFSKLCYGMGATTKVGKIGCIPPHVGYKGKTGMLGKCLAGGVWKKIGNWKNKCCVNGRKFYKHGQKMCLSHSYTSKHYLRCINGRFKPYHGYCFQ